MYVARQAGLAREIHSGGGFWAGGCAAPCMYEEVSAWLQEVR